ncbi:MAG: response regulator [Anaerolineales bacterium]
MKLYVLVIDDNRLIANSLIQMLTLLGHEAKAAYGSMAALQSLGQRTPDVILMDIHMQGLNGIDLCRYIRRDLGLANVAIVGISSDNQPSLVASLREAGADGFLPKPIELDALESLMQQIKKAMSS